MFGQFSRYQCVCLTNPIYSIMRRGSGENDYCAYEEHSKIRKVNLTYNPD